MLKFIDEKGTEHLVQAEIRTGNGVNGDRSISGTIHSNEKVIHAIGRGWKLEFEGELYCISYALPDDDGKDIVIDFDAIHEFFYDFEKSVIYKELNGSNTFDAYLKFIFDGSSYSYRLESQVAAFEKVNFGMKNRLALFKDIINSVGVEFVVSRKVVRIVDKVGTDLSTIVKKGFNLQDLQLEHNIGNFITYKKGYGAFIDPEDETKGRLEVEYKSPLADVYGKLEGDPVIDERYTIKENLLTRLKNEVDNSYSIAVSLSMEDLTEAGYEQERPHAGDYIMAINEDVDFQEKVRIVSFTSSYDIDGELIDHQVSCNSMSMSSRQSKGDKAWKSQVEANLEHAVTNAEYAVISANGKNMSFYGLFGPNGKGEPKATKEGDTWFKPVGEETIVYTWNGKAWAEILSTKDNKIVTNKITEVEKEVELSKKESEKALKDADKALKEADEARKQAFNSEQVANSAKQDAIIAIQKGEGNSSEIKKLDTELKGTVSKVEGNTAQIATLKIESDKVSSTVGKVEADLKNINIGDGNDFPDSEKMRDSKVLVGREFINVKEWDVAPLIDEYGVDKEYTLSVDIKASKAGPVRIYSQNGSSTKYSIGTHTVQATTEWQRIYIIFKPTRTAYDDPKATLAFYGTYDTGVFPQVKKAIFTIGNVKKEWQISARDLTTKSEFSTFEQTSKGFQQTVNSDIAGVKSQQTQMTGQITSTVESIDNISVSNRNYWAISNLAVGYLDANNGTLLPYGDNVASNNFIEIQTDKKNIIFSIENKNKLTSTGSARIVFFDSNKKAIHSKTYSINKDYFEDSIQIPTNAIFFKACIPLKMSEIGNVNTQIEFSGKRSSWSAAPEDNASKSQITQLQDQITSTVAKVETVDGKVVNQQTQITQLSNNINLKVDKNNVVAQINISPETIRLNAKWIHLSGTSLIDNAIIKDAMIQTITATKLTAGTINASNINIINMNASNIVTGTISGANLRINLNTGEVLFNKGIIKKTDDSFVIDLDKGYITNKDPNRLAYFLIKDGGVKFYDRSIFTTTANPVEYGSIMSERQAYEKEGESRHDGEMMILQGKNGVALQTANFDRDSYYDWGKPMNRYRKAMGSYIHLNGGEDWGNGYKEGDVHIFGRSEVHVGSGSFAEFSRSAVKSRGGLHVESNETDTGGQTQTMLIANWYQRSGSSFSTQRSSFLRLNANGPTTLDGASSLELTSGNGGINMSTSSGGRITISSVGSSGGVSFNTPNVTVSGNFRVTGTKNAIHTTSKGWVETPAYETAESYLGDIGAETTGQDGTSIIFIDELFNETVNTKDCEYQVFLQSYSFGSGVYVITRNEKYFIVKSEKPITSFAYEIKAKRKGYEKDRLNLFNHEEEIRNVA